MLLSTDLKDHINVMCLIFILHYNHIPDNSQVGEDVDLLIVPSLCKNYDFVIVC